MVVYVEDPFANHDVKGNQKIINKFKMSAPHVKIGIKAMFNDGNLQKLETATYFQTTEGPNGEMIEEIEANKDKFTPHLVHLNKHHLKNVSDYVNYLRRTN